MRQDDDLCSCRCGCDRRRWPPLLDVEAAPQDEEEVDYKVYNLERLREVFKELELEVYCIYARNYAHMLGQKEEEKW